MMHRFVAHAKDGEASPPDVAEIRRRLDLDRVCALTGLPGTGHRPILEAVADTWRGAVVRVDALSDLPAALEAHTLILPRSSDLAWESVYEVLQNYSECAVLLSAARPELWPHAYLFHPTMLSSVEAVQRLGDALGTHAPSPEVLRRLVQIVGTGAQVLEAITRHLTSVAPETLIEMGPEVLEIVRVEHQSLHALLDARLSACPPEHQRGLHLLVMCEVALPRDLIAAVCGWSVRDAARILAELILGGWVRAHEQARGTLTLQPLGRLFLQDVARERVMMTDDLAHSVFAAVRQVCEELRAARASSTDHVEAVLLLGIEALRHHPEQRSDGEAVMEVLGWARWLGYTPSHLLTDRLPRQWRTLADDLSRFGAGVCADEEGGRYAPWVWQCSVERAHAGARACAEGLERALASERAPIVPAALWLARYEVLEGDGDGRQRLNTIWWELPESADINLRAVAAARAAQVAWLSGSRVKAAMHLDAVPSPDALTLGDVALAHLFAECGRLHLELGFVEKAQVALHRASAFVEATHHHILGAHVALSRVFMAWIQTDMARAHTVCGELLTHARNAGASQWVEVAEILGQIHEALAQGPPYTAAAQWSWSERLLIHHPDVVGMAMALRAVAAREHQEDWPGAFDMIIERASNCGAPTILSLECMRLVTQAWGGGADEVRIVQEWLRRRGATGTAPLETMAVLPAARIIWRHLGDERLAPSGGAAPRVDEIGLIAHPHGHWFRCAEQEPVNLLNRRPLRRILRHLIELRRRGDGASADVQELIEVGWPGEVMANDSGRSRVYATIRQLRELGLQDILVTGEGGYRLDPDTPIYVRDLTVDSVRRISTRADLT